MMLRSRLLATCLVLSSAAAPALSLAQPEQATSTSEADAEALFQKGRAFAKKKEWQAAYDAFLQSQKLRPSHDTAGNLGHVAYKLERFDEAALYLSLSARGLPQTVSADRRKAIQDALAAAKEEVTTVHVTTEPSNAELVVDGAAWKELPVFLLPGEHTIEARADGFTPKSERIVATKGMERTLELRLKPASGTVGAGVVPDGGPPASSDGGAPPGNGDPTRNGGAGSGPSTKTIVVIGGAALFVGAAVLTGVFAAQKSNAESDAEDALGKARAQFGPAPCASNANSSVCQEVADANDRKESAGTRADIALIAAGVLGAGTLAALVFWPDEPARSGSVRVTPSFSTNAAGAFVTGSF